MTGPQDTTQAAWADGKRGIFLVIFKQPGANVIDTVDKIMAELPQLQAIDAAGDQDLHLERPHADDPRCRPDVQFTLAASPSRSW